MEEEKIAQIYNEGLDKVIILVKSMSSKDENMQLWHKRYHEIIEAGRERVKRTLHFKGTDRVPLVD